MCVCMCSKRERGRELHSVVLEFQLTLAKLGGPDKNLSPAGVADPAVGPHSVGELLIPVFVVMLNLAETGDLSNTLVLVLYIMETPLLDLFLLPHMST